MNHHSFVSLLARLGALALACQMDTGSVLAAWQPGKGPLMTRWAKDVSPDKVHPEYPRPQMVRKDWLNLNGLWDYAIADKEATQPAKWDGQILVPFPIESALSGVMKRVNENQRLWYHRTFKTPPGWKGKHVLLHFGAVDWEAAVIVNGREIGAHRGGYDGFSFDITETLKPGGEQEIVVTVWDPTDAGYQPRGKQVREPKGIWYTPTSGIWQTVWLEAVNATSIESVKIISDIDSGSVRLELKLKGNTANSSSEVTILDGTNQVMKATSTGLRQTLGVPNAKLWSPDSPFLYGLRITLYASGKQVDQVESYFGMRKISMAKDEDGIWRLMLNNQRYFQYGPLDQGFWPDGLYTAPTDEALRYDIEMTKKLGFNMARKHVKVEPERWYYWCDKLGLLVWQDMPSGDKHARWRGPSGFEGVEMQRSPESAANYEKELRALIAGRYNHPCIVVWVPFNEGWGQFDTVRILNLTKELDPTRLVDGASGGNHFPAGHILDHHQYPGPATPKPVADRAMVLGEFGGLGLPVKGHTWQDEKNWGYRSFTDAASLTDAYLKLLDQLHPMIGAQGLSAAIYTQTTDVEIEINGLMTYDRAVVKMDAAAIAAAAKKLYTPPPKRGQQGSAPVPAVIATPAKDYPVTPVPFTAVRVQDGFWSPRLETNRVTTVWYDFKKCEETGRIDNFAKAGGLMPGEFRGIPFDDSDVFKVIEGAAYSLALHPDPKLDKYLDDLIVKIAAAQEPDGYLYTARRLYTPEKIPKMSGSTRWSNLVSSHELYNVGHLYEGAVAHFLATGKRSLLDVAVKNADLLCKTFGPGPDQLKEPPGHEEIEIGLSKLYRTTGAKKYLDLARFFVEIRGRADTHKLRGAGQQDHQPVLEQAEAVGHAVRAGYFYSGVADVAALTGDAAYVKAVDRIWENVVGRKLYLTGGVGARHKGEAFGDDYELPNLSAYNETCAAIANALWNHRMFLLHGDAKYLDVLERTIYNGFLSGVALTGDHFFYPNPLASGKGYERSEWFRVSCCPVNVVRFLPSIAGCIYATRSDALYVNLFIGGTAKVKLGGTDVELKQQTRYPWDGKVALTINPAKPAEFTLNVRIPGWARSEPVPSDLYRYNDGLKPQVRLSVNGAASPLKLDKGFAQLKRTWKPGDTVKLELPMPVRRVVAHAAVKDDQYKFAVERGPLVYCAEGVDNPGKLISRVVNPDVRFETNERPDLLNGIVTVKMTPKESEPLTLIPNYAWCHRGPNEMTVWFRTKAEPWSASYCYPNDSAEACFDGKVPANSIDHSIPRMTFWDHKGTTEWVQRDFEQPTTVSSVSVYWFDDTGKGGCRIPQSWRLLYQEGDSWKPVEGAAQFSTQRDTWNTVKFNPVKTTALRLEVRLQPMFSGGILEWRIIE